MYTATMINEHIKLPKAVSLDDLERMKYEDLVLSDEWKAFLGTPEKSGSWIIWGASFNGKTSFALQLAKELAHHQRVIYNSFEEGVGKSIREATRRVNMKEVAANFNLLRKETIEVLKVRLRRRKSADVVFIDSLQYADLDKRKYKALIDDFPKKLFVFISHADNKEPAGSLGMAVKYDAMVKIRVEGFRAFCLSRYGGIEPHYVINEARAQEYWLTA